MVYWDLSWAPLVFLVTARCIRGGDGLQMAITWVRISAVIKTPYDGIVLGLYGVLTTGLLGLIQGVLSMAHIMV